MRFMADRFRPSEQRGSRRDTLRWDGGLLSSTINIDKSLGADDGFVAGKGMVDPSVSIGFTPRVLVRDFACRGVLGVGGAVGFSCKLEGDNGGGVVRSSVDAAQSQWVDRAPYEFRYWCAAK